MVDPTRLATLPTKQKAAKAKEAALSQVRPAWQHECIPDSSGHIMPILANAVTALKGTPFLANAIAYDNMARTTVMATCSRGLLLTATSFAFRSGCRKTASAVSVAALCMMPSDSTRRTGPITRCGTI